MKSMLLAKKLDQKLDKIIQQLQANVDDLRSLTDHMENKTGELSTSDVQIINTGSYTSGLNLQTPKS